MSEINVEIVFALPERQSLLSIAVEPGTTVADIVSSSELRQLFPDCGFDDLAVGIWGSEVGRDRVVRNGDRVEIYRPLALDPKDARRQLALAGRTMGSADID